MSTSEAVSFPSPRLKPTPALVLEPLSQELEHVIVSIIRRNLDPFEQAGSLLAASYRRLRNLYKSYSGNDGIYFVIFDPLTRTPVGGAGIGPLAGLPQSEGLGEIREMVIDAPYRNRGFGTLLLNSCIEHGRRVGYRRIYLATTQKMLPAQRLFQQVGFKPIQDSKPLSSGEELPWYFTIDFHDNR